MIDMGSIAAAVGSLKTAGEIAQGLISLKTMAGVQAKAIELNQKIIAAQHDVFAAHTAHAALVERVRQLEGQIARMEAWETQKKRYQLATPYTGVTVYALKKEMSEGEPAHYICANCFQDGKRSMLQHTKKQGRLGRYRVLGMQVRGPNPLARRWPGQVCGRH